MEESEEELADSLSQALIPNYRRRLLDRGLARNLIWEDGVLPREAPPFAKTLTEDLLDYGYSILSMALRLRLLNVANPILERSFLVAGEAFEAAVHRGKAAGSQGFHRVSAAVAFHLARYSARAFSILPSETESLNLSPTEKVLVHLLRRNFDQMKELFSSWLLNPENHDEQIAARLEGDDEFDEADAIHAVLVNAFMSGIALFDHALMTERVESASEAKKRLFETARAASDMRSVNHWWTATLAAHLLDELWGLSFHERLPVLPVGPDYGEPHARWNELRENYIARLRASKRSAIEFWPSQLGAAKRAVDPLDDLVVALPTSAGKTRIAELCILRCLSNEQRVIYITPLRALSAQIERDLAETFVPLGYPVSTLYGSAGVESGDSETLKKGTIVVATPEKLDFALRNDSSVIDDVGLIVFDEGHMLGKGEREVRYETLVQRILRREDAETRRIVCLSALFPNPEDMEDLVGWIRQDEPGEPVHSTWRPTRQRFGTIERNSYGGGRLEISLGDEQPFVPKFVEMVEAPEGQLRRKPFPSSKNELTIASARKFVNQGKKVLVYCSMKKSVETLGREILNLIERGFITPLTEDSEQLRNVRSVGAEWLGADHPAVLCLEYGVALHHGGLPRQFLNEVEELLKAGACPLTVASPTLAQGLNLSASVLLVPSTWRGGQPIPTTEFANVAGRAGRAFVDLEGLILHMMWDGKQKALKDWKKLVEGAKAPLLESGILRLTIDLFKRIARSKGVSPIEVMEYVTGNSEAWDYVEIRGEKDALSAEEWERDLASLDAALLGMMELDCEVEDIPASLKEALEGSLFLRQTKEWKEASVDAVFDFLGARAGEIWSKTDIAQRQGFYYAGIGLKTGLLISEELEKLLDYLYWAEQWIEAEEFTSATNLIVKFAEVVFKFAPFYPYKGLPEKWKEGLKMWLSGEPSSEVIKTCGKEGVEFLQDGLAYRLPWAMEAVRVHCEAVDLIDEGELSGIVASAVETGSLSQSVITMIRNGLSSREAAKQAFESTDASFDDRDGMLAWLASADVVQKSRDTHWPTVESRYPWLKFFKAKRDNGPQEWDRRELKVGLTRLDGDYTGGEQVILRETDDCIDGLQVLTPDFKPIGETEYFFSLRSSRS